jgi:predicted ArsR family transcriptional regulator
VTEREGKSPKESRTRQALLNALKQRGPSDASALAASLGVSAMGVRQHLYALAEGGLVAYEQEARPVGRPAKLWHLTPLADQFFPDGHAELAVGLIEAMGEAFGREGLERLVAARARRQTEAYRKRIPVGAPLQTRLEALVRIRSEEGYMAEVEPAGSGAFRLIENHCPVCLAAVACVGLCGAELDVFRAVLGPDVSVERTEHIIAGTRRCVYDVRSRER